MTAAPPPGLTLEELANRRGRSEGAVLELLRPFLEAGIVAERGGRLLVVDELVLGAFGQEPASERVSEEGLAGRITAYLERHRANARARRVGRIAEGVTGDPTAIRALLHGRPEYVNEGTAGWHCWALAAWAEEEPAA